MLKCVQGAKFGVARIITKRNDDLLSFKSTELVFRKLELLSVVSSTNFGFDF